MGTYIGNIVTNWNSIMDYFNANGSASVVDDNNDDMKNALVLAKIACKVICKMFNLCSSTKYTTNSDFKIVTVS
ncbi:MAG: hypothetical protein J6S67_03475 [Methanobrevibacter sp.]|nr:hypothetical protein [Methanobrevibacter sp.]